MVSPTVAMMILQQWWIYIFKDYDDDNGAGEDSGHDADNDDDNDHDNDDKDHLWWW